MTTDTLQAMLNKRAENKLNQDIRALYDSLSACRLLSGSPTDRNPLKISVTDKKGTNNENTVPGAFGVYGSHKNNFYAGGELAVKLYDLWLPTYLEEETKLFLKQVESLSEQVAELTDEVNNINHF